MYETVNNETVWDCVFSTAESTNLQINKRDLPVVICHNDLC